MAPEPLHDDDRCRLKAIDDVDAKLRAEELNDADLVDLADLVEGYESGRWDEDFEGTGYLPPPLDFVP